MLLMQAAELAKASRKKHVEVITDVPEEVVAELDEVLLQRMVANLISNAIDASAEGSEVRVELTRLAKTEASRDWVRVRISDRGEGIRKEDLNRVFTPYFTTKNRGDENRGFGLGLAICRKIVNLHGGNLSIASQLKKGTTVQVDLPTRQIKQASPPPWLPRKCAPCSSSLNNHPWRQQSRPCWSR
jgi:signal transduction histidine kinase